MASERRRLGPVAAALALVLTILLAGCASGPAPPPFASVVNQLPPLAAGQARIFFYRYYQLYVSMARPYIRLNGTSVAISEPGGVLYRDVPPGTYLISVDSQGLYPNQNKTVTLAGGETLYVRVDSMKGYDSGFDSYDPEVFAVTLMSPAPAQADMLTLKFYAGP
ncbi:MAG TPA: DUF2846 domain-containing protein [Stellaceae bacterium]|nr:DUF2846 domain-containing protein [Stellaceae bacterium]